MPNRRSTTEAPRHVVLERTREGARARRRVAALAGWALLTGAFLAAIGSAKVALAVIALLATAVVVVMLLSARRRRRRGEPVARLVCIPGLTPKWPLRTEAAPVHAQRVQVPRLVPTAQNVRPYVDATRAGTKAGLIAVRLGTKRLLGELLWLPTALRQASSAMRAALSQIEIPQRTRAATPKPPPARAPAPAPATGGDDLRQALRLNALGADLRREGQPERAVECHRAALEIMEDLGDARGVALTQNNIALALERAGEEDEAVEHFEEAIAILRELDDGEREGQVIANLGVTLLRRGRREEAVELLTESLEKLEPDSRARLRVERQLLRVG
jgi:tetratricopeptide (TPR) repeat protein